jgi:hypothetical protein
MRLTLAIVVGVGLLALPAHAVPSSESATQTIRLISTPDGQPRTVVDRAPKGTVSPGDVFAERSILRNAVAQFGRPKGAVVGSDVATYTVVSLRRANAKGTVRLPAGTLRIAATLTPQQVTFRVVGGSGRYADARGVLEVRSLNAAGTRVLNVYRLTLP